MSLSLDPLPEDAESLIKKKQQQQQQQPKKQILFSSRSKCYLTTGHLLDVELLLSPSKELCLALCRYSNIQ